MKKKFLFICYNSVVVVVVVIVVVVVAATLSLFSPSLLLNLYHLLLTYLLFMIIPILYNIQYFLRVAVIIVCS